MSEVNEQLARRAVDVLNEALAVGLVAGKPRVQDSVGRWREPPPRMHVGGKAPGERPGKK
jgi:hypothetical protein